MIYGAASFVCRRNGANNNVNVRLLTIVDGGGRRSALGGDLGQGLIGVIGAIGRIGAIVGVATRLSVGGRRWDDGEVFGVEAGVDFAVG